MKWRLGLDLGTNSIGWWAFRVERPDGNPRAAWHAVESLDGGVGIFSEGREPSKAGRVGDSLAVGRRLARGMRRNRDHGRNRISALVRDLTELGLLPTDADERDRLFQTPAKRDGDPERHNPYRLRAEALERTLTPHELGRALFHLGLRRGFKSNRKEASDEDGGKLKERIDALKTRLGGQTLGQYLWQAFQDQNDTENSGGDRHGIRFRGEDELYPERAMVAAEFDAIREQQKTHHTLGDDDWDRLRNQRILFQWPLRPVERGKCEFFPDQERHWKDTPIGHDFRLYQELNSLKWIDRERVDHALDMEQRDAILDLLLTRKSDVTFASMRKLKRADKSRMFEHGSRFNLESDKRKALKPHRIAATLGTSETLGWLWSDREDQRLDGVFEVLHDAEDDTEATKLLTEDFGFEEEVVKALIALPLASGTANVSRKFMESLVPVLRDQGLVYADAVAELKDDDGNQLHHSLRDDDRRWTALPYYGEVLAQSMLGADPAADAILLPEKHFGKINNPTVHVALNRLRKLVNCLVERFGPPIEVHVELTRDLKQSRQKRDEVTKEQGRRERENDRIKKDICVPLGMDYPTALDIKKVKLWEELGKDSMARRCVFSGQTISAADLFNGEAEIEHILPFKRTLDDSMANLTVAKRWANRIKGNDTPYEAFAQDLHAERGVVWDEILQRSELLPDNKRWRFGPNAMERYETEEGFIARQLTDTAYMARVATRYLKSLEGVEHVLASPGRLTALIRGKWHLNGILGDDNLKSRDDHRHHAVDAAVIALTDRGVLNAVSRLTARGADDRVHLVVPDLDENLEKAIRARVPAIIVAYKPDHGLQGQMYNETAYGFVPENRRDEDLPEHGLVARKELAGLTPKECLAIRDLELRRAVAAWLENAKDAGEKHDKALADFVKEKGVRRVRVLIQNKTANKVQSAPYKRYAPNSYVCCDIWRIPKGKPGKWQSGAYEWRGKFWSYADTIAGSPDKIYGKPRPAAKFVTRLFKDDVIAIGSEDDQEILRVAGFSTTDNRLDLKPQHLVDAPRKYQSINILGHQGVRRLHITPDGRILSSKRRGQS